jgi:hypothetical protein
MKKLIAVCIIICLLAPQTAHAREISPASADIPNPSEAAREMLESIVTWEQGRTLDFFAGNPDIQTYLSTFGGVIEQLAKRINYEVYAHKITAHTAVVDVRISAVDIGAAARSLLAQSATYIAFQRLMGRPADLNTYLSARAGVIIPELHTIATTTSIHMIQGADSAWKLDLSNQENLHLLNAMCGGGILPYITAIETLLERVSG